MLASSMLKNLNVPNVLRPLTTCEDQWLEAIRHAEESGSSPPDVRSNENVSKFFKNSSMNEFAAETLLRARSAWTPTLTPARRTLEGCR